jgi:hypothetical protein
VSSSAIYLTPDIQDQQAMYINTSSDLHHQSEPTIGQSPLLVGTASVSANHPKDRSLIEVSNNSAPSTISMRPGVQVLGVFQHLNYKAWYALAEFVDNSLQSFLANQDRLRQLHGEDFVLTVDIDIEDTGAPRIVVRDNAAGIASSDFQRAFRPADVPPVRSGLSEFGMGMKSAACWFAPKWRVRTKALGETETATITVDVSNIVASGIEHIEVKRTTAHRDQHFTELTLESLHQVPRRRGLGKIRTHLADIYRVFLRRGLLKLRVNGELVEYVDPAVLTHPRHDAPSGAPAVEWRKEISVVTSTGVRVHGFAGLLAVGKASGAGFALFRRDRLIQGLSEEGWKPEEIFGRPNSFRSQRLFGELFVEGVAVSHTKDGFRLEDHEEELLPLLRDALESEPLPLLTQAERMRVRPPKIDLATAAATGIEGTIATVERHGTEPLATVVAKGSLVVTSTDTATLDPIPLAPATASTSLPSGSLPTSTPLVARRESRTLTVDAEEWQIVLELSDDPAVSEWIKVLESQDAISRSITIRFSLAHPFVQRFVVDDLATLEPLIRIACAMGLSQVLARKAGVAKAGVVVLGVNELLREVLCHD